jgi:hypothetical protein
MLSIDFRKMSPFRGLAFAGARRTSRGSGSDQAGPIAKMNETTAMAIASRVLRVLTAPFIGC